MTIGMRWFPDRKGMAMGVVVGGFGGGAFIFNQIQVLLAELEYNCNKEFYKNLTREEF